MYDSTWPDHYETERRRLLGVFADTAVWIEHVGSTAVPGLAAKPIIDVMLGAEHLVEVERRIPALELIGYQYVRAYERQLPERRYFRRPRHRPRAFHLHCVVRGSAFWDRHLRFRDILRSRPDLALEYGELKRRLAARFGSDRRAYSDGKTPFIEGVLASGQTEPGQVR